VYKKDAPEHRTTTKDGDEREYLRKAHECLMKGGGYLGKAYRIQVERVRKLRKQLNDQNSE
jgi:hypothetical protein